MCIVIVKLGRSCIYAGPPPPLPPSYINILLEPTLKNYILLFKKIFPDVHFLILLIAWFSQSKKPKGERIVSTQVYLNHVTPPSLCPEFHNFEVWNFNLGYEKHYFFAVLIFMNFFLDMYQLSINHCFQDYNYIKYFNDSITDVFSGLNFY